MHMDDLPRRPAGFTLVELIVTILIIAVLAAIALPSFRSVIQRNRVTTAHNELLASLAYARTTAITRGQLVSVCPSADGNSCTNNGKAFEPGWIVYTYPAGAASANTAYAEASATLLRTRGSFTGVSINAQQTGVITFGLQGQLRPSTALIFLTCARDGTSGIGVSTATAPGVRMDVNGSGSVTSEALGASASCGS